MKFKYTLDASLYFIDENGYILFKLKIKLNFWNTVSLK